MRNILLAVVAATGLVGCVGGVDMSGGGGGSGGGGSGGSGGSGGGSDNSAAAVAAKSSFDTGVYPIISASGRCITCHNESGPQNNSTGFVAPAAADGYTTAVGYVALVGDLTSGAPILAKIAAGHENMTYSDADKTAITDWLNKELTKRSSGGTGGTGTGSNGGESPGDASLRLTKEWSGCMTLANFTTANMIAFGNMRADNSACKTCHVNGEYGQVASDVAAPFFTMISTNRYYMAQYFAVDLSGGVATAKIIPNTVSLTNMGKAIAPHVEHPRFNFTNSTGATALQKFYDLTMAAKTAGTCGPSTLTN